MDTFPPYCVCYGTCQGTAEAKSVHHYHRTRSGSYNSPGLLYTDEALHVSKANGACKEPEQNRIMKLDF